MLHLDPGPLSQVDSNTKFHLAFLITSGKYSIPTDEGLESIHNHAADPSPAYPNVSDMYLGYSEARWIL